MTIRRFFDGGAEEIGQVPVEATGVLLGGTIQTTLGALTATIDGKVTHRDATITTVLGAITATAIGTVFGGTVTGTISTVLGGLTATAIGRIPPTPPDRYFAPALIYPATGPRHLSAL